MIQYFKELLATLKAIETHLSEIRKALTKTPYGHSKGNRTAFRTIDWNSD